MEHLDNLHFVVNETFRTAKKVIIVLPNSLNIFTFLKVMFGKNLGGNEGLPLITINDRHKWIYNVNQVDNFMGYYAYLYKKKYKTFYFTHAKACNLLTRINKNLFSNEMMYIFY